MSGPQSHRSSDRRTSEVRQPRPLRVLLVDDSQFHRTVARLLLEKTGHCVTTAADGLDALQEFESGSFDVILMDVRMPGLNGWDLTRRIRSSEGTRGPWHYIIAMTGLDTPSDRQQCLAAGMDDYLAKPIRAAALQGALERMQQVSLAVGEEASGACCDSDPPDGCPRPDLQGLPVIDWRAAETKLPGGADFLCQLSETLSDECRECCHEIDEGLARDDAAQVARAAHTIKSSTEMCGAERVQRLAEFLERLSRGGHLTEVADWLTRLRQETESLSRVLQQRAEQSTARPRVRHD